MILSCELSYIICLQLMIIKRPTVWVFQTILILLSSFYFLAASCMFHMEKQLHVFEVCMSIIVSLYNQYFNSVTTNILENCTLLVIFIKVNFPRTYAGTLSGYRDLMPDRYEVSSGPLFSQKCVLPVIIFVPFFQPCFLVCVSMNYVRSLGCVVRIWSRFVFFLNSIKH